MKIRNSSHGFLAGVVRVFGSNFKAFKFSTYPKDICLKKTQVHKNYIVQWVAKFPACSTNFLNFPIAIPHLNGAWGYKMVTNFRQYFFWGKVGLASNLLEMSHKISVNCVD